jgi:hypothetical protein
LQPISLGVQVSDQIDGMQPYRRYAARSAPAAEPNNARRSLTARMVIAGGDGAGRCRSYRRVAALASLPS